MSRRQRRQQAVAESAGATRGIPERAAERESNAEPPATRRAFLWTTWLSLAGVAALEAVWIVVDLLRPRATVAPDGDVIVVAGPVERFKPGSVTAFPTGRFYLVRLDDGGFLAVSRTCTHLGCTVPWTDDRQRFVCPCHGSAFDRYGVVVNPPAPRPLDLMEIRIENRVVKVNTANVRRRSAFDPAQVTRA